MASPTARLDTDLPSPSFIVDLDRVQRNCDRMLALARAQRLELRPHMKTHKTVEGALLQVGGDRSSAKIVVSTLAEAEFYAAAGFPDVAYAVPIEPSKFERALALHASLPAFHVMVDSLEAAEALDAAAASFISRI